MTQVKVRVLFALAVAVTPAAAQNALVRLLNVSHPPDSVFSSGGSIRSFDNWRTQPANKRQEDYGRAHRRWIV